MRVNCQCHIQAPLLLGDTGGREEVGWVPGNLDSFEEEKLSFTHQGSNPRPSSPQQVAPACTPSHLPHYVKSQFYYTAELNILLWLKTFPFVFLRISNCECSINFECSEALIYRLWKAQYSIKYTVYRWSWGSFHEFVGDRWHSRGSGSLSALDCSNEHD
jgi:hypothetical protein